MPKTSTQSLLCRWTSCPHQEIPFDTQDELAQHVQSSHVLQFEDKDEIVCLWEGCKVYNHLSRSSIAWLESHVRMKHTKDRPHKCLMNGCNMSFNTPDALQRHLLRHFDPTPLVAKSPPKKKKKIENALPKCVDAPLPQDPPIVVGEAAIDKKLGLVSQEGSEVSSESSGEGKRGCIVNRTLKPRPQKRNSFKVKIPRHSLCLSTGVPTPLPFNGAHFHPEVLDRRTMSVIRARACQLAQVEGASGCSEPSIMVTAQVLGKRKRSCHFEDELLIRWSPKLVADSWVLKSQYQPHSLVSFSRLTSRQQSVLAQSFFGLSKPNSRRSKRKP